MRLTAHTLLITAAAALASACSRPAAAPDSAPVWLETDSAAAIDARTRADFPYTMPEFEAMVAGRYPGYTAEQLSAAVDAHYVETMVIDDTLRVFRKALRNMGLLDPVLNSRQVSRNSDATAARLAELDSTAATPDGDRRITYRFSIDVPYSEAIAGDTLRVWMPVPVESERQSDVTILSSVPAAYTLSEGRSPHNTLYMEVPAPAAPGDTARLEYTGAYTVRGKYVSPDYIRSHLRPYDTASETYRRYTALPDGGPHMVRLDSMARAIAGDATDPYTMSERVFDYIDSTYLWAGAREYSTIGCIPRYVVDEGHGDCGQVSLLYISLMRSLGVPARWESGWMLHPGSKNYHDWAEVYFEGVGWVPVDVSFGRFPGASSAKARDFYSTGIHGWRFATNTGVAGELYPAKRYVRSETVDFQAGEVECSRGNIFYPAWDHTLTILSSDPVKCKAQ